MNPLDQALTNVIQNLIGIDDSITSTSEAFSKPDNEIIVENIEKEDSTAKDSLVLEPIVESWSVSEADSSEIINDEDTKEVPVSVTAEEEKQPLSIVPEEEQPLSIAPEGQQPLSVTEESQNATETAGEKAKSEEPLNSSVSHIPNVISAVSMQPVFSIGPFLPFNVSPSTVKNVQFSDPLIVGPSNRFFAPVFGASLSDEQFSPPSDTSTCQEAESKEKKCIVDVDNVSVDSTSNLNAVEDFSTVVPVSTSSPIETTGSSDAGGSSKQGEKKVVGAKNRTPEEALVAREDRLKRLEEQAKWLMNKMNATSRRGSALSTRLEELHEVYGEPPVPPPMPDVLPARRLRTNLSDLPRQVRMLIVVGLIIYRVYVWI